MNQADSGSKRVLEPKHKRAEAVLPKMVAKRAGLA